MAYASFWADSNGKTWATIPIKTPYNKAKERYKALRQFVFERDGHVCQICGGDKWVSLDHVTPKRAGGSNHPDNLQALCHSCNSRKVKTDREKFPPCLMPA